MIHQRTSHDICNLRIVVNAGSYRETACQYGVAHFLEHMFFKGTLHRTQKETRLLASRLGDINAFTGHEETVYTMDFLAQDFEKAANLLLEMVLEPAFPEDEFDKERGVIQQERQSRLDDPMRFMWDSFFQDMFGDVGHAIIGTEDSIARMKIEDLTFFRNCWYCGANKQMVLVGNVERERALPFDEILRKDRPDAASPHVESINNYRRLSLRHPTKQAILVMAWPGISRAAECELNEVPDILANAIGGGMHSLLFERLREELGLCYSTGAHHSSWHTHGVFSAYVMLDEEHLAQAEEEIVGVLEKVCREGISEDLLTTAKRNYLFGQCERFQSAGGIASAANMMFGLSDFQLDRLLSLDSRKQQVAQINMEDVVNFACRTFGPGSPCKVGIMTQG